MKRGRSGNIILETALWMPVLLLLVAGMIQIGKITYIYYSLQKIMYSAARDLSVQQGVNFCDTVDDPITQATIQLAINDPSTGLPLVSNLTPAMFQVTTTCLDPTTGAPGPCDTSGCASPALAAAQPGFVTVSLIGGYPVQPRIPYVLLPPINLQPSATLPFAGSSL